MDGPPSVNYGWSYFHMDSPTDKNPPDSGLLRLITDGPTDKSSGLRIRILRTPDPGPFFGTADSGRRTGLAIFFAPNGGLKELSIRLELNLVMGREGINKLGAPAGVPPYLWGPLPKAFSLVPVSLGRHLKVHIGVQNMGISLSELTVLIRLCFRSGIRKRDQTELLSSFSIYFLTGYRDGIDRDQFGAREKTESIVGVGAFTEAAEESASLVRMDGIELDSPIPTSFFF